MTAPRANKEAPALASFPVERVRACSSGQLSFLTPRPDEQPNRPGCFLEQAVPPLLLLDLGVFTQLSEQAVLLFFLGLLETRYAEQTTTEETQDDDVTHTKKTPNTKPYRGGGRLGSCRGSPTETLLVDGLMPPNVCSRPLVSAHATKKPYLQKPFRTNPIRFPLFVPSSVLIAPSLLAATHSTPWTRKDETFHPTACPPRDGERERKTAVPAAAPVPNLDAAGGKVSFTHTERTPRGKAIVRRERRTFAS